MVGGNAVFRARAMYYLIHSEQEFDDPALCLAHGLITKSMKLPEVAALTMVPNPATDEATLVLTKPPDEAGTLVMFNALGAVVMNVRIPADQQRVALSTTALVPGMYHYRVQNAHGELGDGKLSIVR